MVGGSSSRDCPLGDAEDFLRRLEDKTHKQDRQSAPTIPGSSSMDNVGGVFPSTSTLVPPAITLTSAQHLFPSSSSSSSASASTSVNNNGTSRLPDSSSSSLFCSICTYYIARNMRDLINHQRTHHFDHGQQHQPVHSKQPSSNRMLTSEEREQRVFKCPYCNVQAKGRNAIENHVINHSAGEEGPDRLYWCSFCTLKCRSAPGLSSHMKRHEYQGDC
ncbi:hypothetical protein Hamer_G001150 [Homarus americanus]|uniref:C2H2-type domain-containing protein n=1 Tax=Homarus americanus TaxID=6706 RepID=A0A8J5N2W4_HOMAM|nr:hypothetical protein Hamer_G001150 [Homarus americanus]